MRHYTAWMLAGLVTTVSARAHGDSGAGERVIGVREWRIIERESGPDNYYSVVKEGLFEFIRARYVPGERTAVLCFAVSEEDKSRARALRWHWRAIELPRGGDECTAGRTDSAAVVYVTWKRMLRWYTIKYVWSAVGTKGAVCDRRRTPFSAQDTVILESGGPVGAWAVEAIDLRAEFRKHFEGGNPDASVPDFIGVGIMSDGDQTHSESAADYAQFILSR